MASQRLAGYAQRLGGPNKNVPQRRKRPRQDMTRQRVFISYSREDRPFVDRLSQDLRSGGVATWQDTKEIAAGENWRMAIEESLRSASAMLYVASAASSSSHWMAKEVEAVLGRGTRVIPVILDDQGELGLPSFLREYQWVDSRPGYEGPLAQLLTALQPFRAEAPAGPSKQQAKGYVFLSYAEEDASFVDELKGFLKQRDYGYWDYRESDRDYHYIDMSVKEAYSSEWKERVSTRTRRSDGVIALVSKNSLTSSGQKWELACAREEKKRVLGIWAYKDDRTDLAGVRTVVWTWDAIKDFIDGL